MWTQNKKSVSMNRCNKCNKELTTLDELPEFNGLFCSSCYEKLECYGDRDPEPHVFTVDENNDE